MTRDATPVRTAVVGVGYWGPNLVRNLSTLPDASLQLVCEHNAERREKIALGYPGLRTTALYEDVLADDSIEAVVIATQVGTHAELAEAALTAGKHVLVEKPLAASTAEAEALVELADRNGLTLMPGHTFLYSPPVNLIRDVIRSGELGDIHFVSSSRVNLGLHQSDVSVIWDLGPHDFSILHHWLGERPDRVLATARSCAIPGVVDVAFVSLEYPSGILAHVELAWLAPSKLRRTAIVGSEKMVVYDDTSPEPVKIYDSGVVPPPGGNFSERLSYRTGNVVAPQVDATEPLFLELQDFCRAIRTGEPPVSSAALGLEIVRVVEAAERSAHEGGRVAVGAPA
jgi:predicted dehydrogenase